MNFIYVVTFILFVIGLFDPHTSLFWYPQERTRWTSVLVYGGILFLLAFTASPDQGDRALVSPEPVIADTAGNVMVTDSTTTIATAEVDEAAKMEEKRIRNKLQSKAEEYWPNDYTTQEFWINQELEDYKIMLAIPDNRIKRQAERDWPYDFSTQRFWYEEQIAAKERLNHK